MPYFDTIAEWYEQSSLLLKAEPTTTRITSKYSVIRPTAAKISKRKRYAEKSASRPSAETTGSPPPPQRADPEAVTPSFKVKTYNDKGGQCLQYETNKAHEVGRLIQCLSRLGRHMAALPDVALDLSAPAEQPGTGTGTPVVEKDVKLGGPALGAGQNASGAGGKKKKKGKK